MWRDYENRSVSRAGTQSQRKRRTLENVAGSSWRKDRVKRIVPATNRMGNEVYGERMKERQSQIAWDIAHLVEGLLYLYEALGMTAGIQIKWRQIAG